MNLQAIVYTSETGHTKKYAELLGKKISLPVCALDEAEKALSKSSEVIYLGWLMAGKIKGYAKAAKNFEINAVCGVGMSGGDTQIADMRKNNHVPDNMPLFYLQGGFEIEKLHGINKLMMQTMKKTVGKSLSDKQNRTSEEDDMLELLLNGGDRVSAENLKVIVDWVEENNDSDY